MLSTEEPLVEMLVFREFFYQDGIGKIIVTMFSESETKNECGTDHVSVINFHHLYPVKD